MLSGNKKFTKEALANATSGLRITWGIDYRTLSAYILKITRHKDINDVLIKASRCLKDNLDYELFGFVLKKGTSLDLWIEPQAHTTLLFDFLRLNVQRVVPCPLAAVIHASPFHPEQY